MTTIYECPRICKVYRLYCTDSDNPNSYVGSTVSDIEHRLHTHKSSCSKGDMKKLYKYVREYGGWDCFRIEVLEVCLVSSRDEQTHWEQIFIDKLNPTLNERVAQQTTTEVREAKSKRMKAYYEKNREAILAKQRAYNEKHADSIRERSKIYRANNKEAIAIRTKKYCAEHKDEASARHKAWKARNEDKVKAYKRQYYLDNIDKVKAKDKIKVTCECGHSVVKSYLNKHKKTKKHLNAMGGSEPKNEQVTCECGHSVVKSYLNKHRKTKKHLKAMI